MSDGIRIFREPRRVLALAAGVSIGLALATAHSAPLPREDCDKLAAERTALMSAGIVDQMAKGPAWAKGNLPAAKMTEVERFIAIDEQLSFRCGMSRMKLDIPDEEQAAGADAKKPGPPVKGAPVAKKASPPKAAATVPAAKKPAASTASAPKAPAPVLKPPAAPRKSPVAPSEPTTAGDAAKKATAASPPPAPPKPKPKPKPKPAEPTTDPS